MSTQIDVNKKRADAKAALAGAGGGPGAVQQFVAAVTLAQIQAATSGVGFNVGAPLPAGALVVASEIVAQTGVNGGSLTNVTAKLEGGSDPDGSMISAGTVFVTGDIAAQPGSNPYQSRGGQQLKITLTATADTLAHATAGGLFVLVSYYIG